MKQEGYNRLRCARTGGISADLLKLTAIITMLIDHIGAGILERLLIDGYVTDYALYLKIYQLDSVLRIIGRISFPIFCFLLAEGFLHTRSRRGYAFRLLVFALLSEIPFDLLFSGGFNGNSQNVFYRISTAFHRRTKPFVLSGDGAVPYDRLCFLRVDLVLQRREKTEGTPLLFLPFLPRPSADSLPFQAVFVCIVRIKKQSCENLRLLSYGAYAKISLVDTQMCA